MATTTGFGPLLVAGGTADPNLSRLVEVAQAMGVTVEDARHQLAASPGFSWDLGESSGESSATLNQKPLAAVGAFIRYDVFSEGIGKSGSDLASSQVISQAISQRAAGWYQALYGWLLSHPEVRLFNRHALPVMGNKPAILMWAKQLGLAIPPTWLTNEVEQIRAVADSSAAFQGQGAIAKPTAGGDFCYPLEDLLASAEFRAGCGATPALVQHRLIAPEVRIYIVGDCAFAFEMRSPSLDYRVKQDAEVIPLATLPAETEQLRVLMDKLNMDFGAADFKTDPHSHQLVFLELNSSPMFVRFDQTVGGALCEAMIHKLISVS